MSNKQSAVNKFFPVIDFIDEGVVFNNRSKTDNKFLCFDKVLCNKILLGCPISLFFFLLHRISNGFLTRFLYRSRQEILHTYPTDFGEIFSKKILTPTKEKFTLLYMNKIYLFAKY